MPKAPVVVAAISSTVSLLVSVSLRACERGTAVIRAENALIIPEMVPPNITAVRSADEMGGWPGNSVQTGPTPTDTLTGGSSVSLPIDTRPHFRLLKT